MIVVPARRYRSRRLLSGARLIQRLAIEAGEFLWYFFPMSTLRKITIEVPEKDLALAQEHCGGSITEAVRQGLERMASERRRDILLSLQGKVKFSDSWQTLRGKDDED
jgi:hypothetical protein